MLTKDNILGWQSDLDAFESAIYANVGVVSTADPYGGLPLEMAWVDPRSSLGSWLYRWLPSASRNMHRNVGAMKIHNAWVVSRHGDEGKLFAAQDRIGAENNGRWTREKPLFQDSDRPGVPSARKGQYAKSNTFLLLHGSRSVNIAGILRKSLVLPNQLAGVAITGALFGPSLYFSDDFKKSAGYTSLSGSYWSSGSGAIKGRQAFMFLADTVLGNPYLASGAMDCVRAPSGFHSVFGKADHTRIGGYGTLKNNEWVVYKTEQCMLRYLVEFSA